MAGFAAGLADFVFLCVRHTAGRLGLLLLPLSLLLAAAPALAAPATDADIALYPLIPAITSAIPRAPAPQFAHGVYEARKHPTPVNPDPSGTPHTPLGAPTPAIT